MLIHAYNEGEFKHKLTPKILIEVPLVKKHTKSKTEDDTFLASVLEDLPEAAELEQISKLK